MTAADDMAAWGAERLLREILVSPSPACWSGPREVRPTHFLSIRGRSEAPPSARRPRPGPSAATVAVHRMEECAESSARNSKRSRTVECFLFFCDHPADHWLRGPALHSATRRHPSGTGSTCAEAQYGFASGNCAIRTQSCTSVCGPGCCPHETAHSAVADVEHIPY